MTSAIGLLHPGAMGSVLASGLPPATGQQVLWVGAGRSAESRARAEQAGLTEVESLEELCGRTDLILSVCPPEAAQAVAADVVACGFSGRYVDANAVSPETARHIAAMFDDFVDGGIVGPPPTSPGLTRLYLSGPKAPSVAELFAGTMVEARVVDGGAGAASAVKMCFASWTKGTWALLLAIRALADAEGVTDALLGEWHTSMPDLVARSEAVTAAVGPKAWRFEAEMLEIASTFAANGLPGDFHQGAAEVYRRMASLKGTTQPELAEALALLNDGSPER